MAAASGHDRPPGDCRGGSEGLAQRVGLTQGNSQTANDQAQPRTNREAGWPLAEARVIPRWV